jgi:hypothetical protein
MTPFEVLLELADGTLDFRMYDKSYDKLDSSAVTDN